MLFGALVYGNLALYELLDMSIILQLEGVSKLCAVHTYNMWAKFSVICVFMATVADKNCTDMRLMDVCEGTQTAAIVIAS